MFLYLDESNNIVDEEILNLSEAVEGTQVILTESQTNMVYKFLSDRLMGLVPALLATAKKLPALMFGAGSKTETYVEEVQTKVQARLKPMVEKDAAKLKQLTVTNNLSEDAAPEFNNSIAGYFKAALSEINFAINEVKAKRNPNLADAVLSTLALFVINTIAISTLMAILMGVLGASVATASVAAMILGAVLIAPLTEEYAKKHAIDNGFSSEFILVFNIAEFTSYVARAGFSIGMMILRLLPVLMHFATVAIQKGRIKSSDLPDAPRGVAVSGGNFLDAVKFHGIYNASVIAIEVGVRSLISTSVNAASKA